MKKMCRCIVFLLLGLSFVSHASWVSSGGENLGNSFNPWFLQNTEKVEYCVQVDKTGFSISQDQIQDTLVRALAYWTEDFKKLHEVKKNKLNGKYTEIRIGTQKFVQTDCKAETDIRFLFGSSSLASSEREYLRDLKKILGMTVRTHYDPNNLRARGFVYIGSDQGPESFVDPQRMIEKPWSQEGLLFRILAHELGHVFGFGHGAFGLMMSQYPEMIVLKDRSNSFYDSKTLPSQILPPEFQNYCNWGGNQELICGEDLQFEFLNALRVVGQDLKKLFGAGPEVFLPSQLVVKTNRKMKETTGRWSLTKSISSPEVLKAFIARENLIEDYQLLRQCRSTHCQNDQETKVIR